MAAPALQGGDGADVDGLRAEADARARAAVLFFDEGGDLHPVDAAQAVDDAVGLFGAGAGRRKVVQRDSGHQGAPAGDGPGARDGPGPQAQGGLGAALVEQRVEARDVDAELHQPRRRAERLRRGAVVMEVAGVERDARVEGCGGLRRRLQPERAGDVAHELAGAACGTAHERELAVMRVVVVVVDIDGHVAPAGQRQAVRVAGVERVQRGVGGRSAAVHPSLRQQHVAERQELVLGDPQSRVHAELREEVEHPRGRAQRVGVRFLVDGERHAGLAAHAAAHRVQVGGERLHPSSSPPSAASSAASIASVAPPSTSSPPTRISGCSSPSTSASRLSARSMRMALSSVSS